MKSGDKWEVGAGSRGLWPKLAGTPVMDNSNSSFPVEDLVSPMESESWKWSVSSGLSVFDPSEAVSVSDGKRLRSAKYTVCSFDTL